MEDRALRMAIQKFIPARIRERIELMYAHVLSRGGQRRRSGVFETVAGDDFAIDFQQADTGGSPGNGRSDVQSVFTELREQVAVAMQESDVLREAMNIADAMDK